MKPDQIDKQLSWMDEQRRKESENIRFLERKLDSAVELVNTQENQIKELSSEVTRISALATQIHQFDDALGKQRDSFSQKIADSEGIFLERQKYQEDLRKNDYDELSKSVSEIKLKIHEVEKIADVLDARKHEEIRLLRKIDTVEENVDTLIVGVEEQSRNVNAVDEARKLDARRISDLQSESTELRIKLDSQRGVQDSVEDRVRRIETSVENITNKLERRREIYSLWEEKQELRMVEFEKKWKEWQVEFVEFQQKAEDIDERIIKYDKNYRALSQTKMDLDKIIEKLERRISEISEIQRISEERIKQEWTSYQADEQKRWNTYKLTNDELWRDHARVHDKIPQELQVLSEGLNDGIITLEEIAESSKQRVMDLFTMVSQWTEDIDKKVTEIR